MSEENDTQIATVRPLHASSALASSEAYRADIARWESLIASGGLPKHVDTPAKAMAIARYGEAFGWDAMRALNAIYIVEGRPSMSAEAMLGLVRERMPHAKILPGKCDHTQATIRAKREPDDEWSEFTFTLDDAKRANLLGKFNWKAYPGAMCWARAASICCRRLFPDVIQGAYVATEIEDVHGPDGGRVRQASSRRSTVFDAPPEPEDAPPVDVDFEEPDDDTAPPCPECGWRDGHEDGCVIGEGF